MQGCRILCLSLTFCALFGSAYGGTTHTVPVGSSNGAIQSLVNSESVRSGDTLLFPQSTFIFSEEVYINKNLGLCGAEFSEGGPLTILEKSGGANCRFFSFSGDGGGESGVRFIAFDGNGLYASDSGRAIFCSGSFSGGVHSSLFAGNRASSGGAIYCYGSFTGGVHSSIFADNKALWGGAIFCNGSLTGGVHSSIFSGNETNWNAGGAICCGSTFSGGVHSSTFSGNKANWNGGAIYCEENFTGESGAFADLGGSYFLGNGAGTVGGAIYC
ncbi:MAG: hypothetical protein LBH53_01760, partial [Puniceicoccales bacterium]|nr:hypothetical protein [Puniceicoccales bacterium]